MLALRQAAALGASRRVRFARADFMIGCKARTPRERCRSSRHEEPACVIEALSARLKVPNAHRELAILTARHHTLCTARRAEAATILTLLENCDAFRRPERLPSCCGV